MNATALRKLTVPWPGVEVDIKWGNDLVFSVGGKMFCACAADDSSGISFKVEPERFLELTDRAGIVPAPYLAHAHWVMLTERKALPQAELKGLIRRAYELVRAKLPKRRQLELAD